MKSWAFLDFLKPIQDATKTECGYCLSFRGLKYETELSAGICFTDWEDESVSPRKEGEI